MIRVPTPTDLIVEDTEEVGVMATPGVLPLEFACWEALVLGSLLLLSATGLTLVRECVQRVYVCCEQDRFLMPRRFPFKTALQPIAGKKCEDAVQRSCPELRSLMGQLGTPRIR